MERTLTKSRTDRRPADFGDLTWLRHFDEDDLAQFVTELRQTLSLAYHDDDLAALVDAMADWKATADELADPARREVLLGGVDAADRTSEDHEHTGSRIGGLSCGNVE